MLRNLDTIYYIARSSKNLSTEINFSENIFFGLQRYNNVHLKNTSFVGCRRSGNKLIKHNSVLLLLLFFPPLLPSLSACRCPALHIACCPRPPLFSCRRPRRRCRHAPLLLNQSSSPDVVITISPLVPPSFVDCCFKWRTKPLLPMMVPSLSSRLPSLVGCFH